MEQTFRYRAVDEKQKIVEGVVQAESEQDAVLAIRDRKQTPIRVESKEQQSKDIKIFKEKVTLPELSMFCKQVSTMLFAGISLSKAFETLIKQTKKKLFHDTLQNVSDSIKQGDTLSRAMGAHPNIFPALLLKTVESGELTGKLDESFEHMSVQFAKEHKINSKMKSAMIYPLVLFSLTIVVAVLMMVFVAPMIFESFKSSNAPLPLPTKMLMAISDSLINYWYIYLIVIGGSAYGIATFLKSPKGRYAWDDAKLKLPMLKHNIQMMVTARFTRTLSTLVDSGVPIVSALYSAAATAHNVVAKERVDEAVEGVKTGQTMAVELAKTEIFPDMMITMVDIGEQTGEIDTLLHKVADYYDEELDTAVARLTAMLEPIMIIIMAVFIGFIVIALMVPMMTMSMNTQM